MISSSFMISYCFRIDKVHLPFQSPVQIYDLVWAKFGRSRWWPAIIITHSDCHMDMPKTAHHWVFWFGDHMISQVSYLP